MKHYAHSALVLLVFAMGIPALTAQGAESRPEPDSSTGALTIRTDVDSAVVLVNGRRAGIAPLTLDSLDAGTYIVKVFHPDVSSWFAGVVTDTVRLPASDHVWRFYRLRPPISILSIPSGAQVLIGDSLAGTTPFVFSFDSTTWRSRLEVRKAGFEAADVHPPDARRGVLIVPLVAVSSHTTPESPDLEFKDRIGPSRTGLYVSTVTTVLAGIATAYLKIKADDRNDSYIQTGNPAFLTERNRLDRGAAVTLTLTQIGFGLFTYFLLSD